MSDKSGFGWHEIGNHPLYRTEHDGWKLETTMSLSDDGYHWIVSATRGEWRHVCTHEFEFPSDALAFMRGRIDDGNFVSTMGVGYES